ncbi:MAG: ChaB family protein [Candidatus Dormibacteraeota bacterium]|nr:ChaB family protein [Candidatus Dormibacteraeota bacterium]
MPGKEVLPTTLKRSQEKAQRTWAKVHDNAVKEYGEGERAHRTAYGALKHSYEKVGDRWEPKKQRGPSDPQAARTDRGKRDRPSATAGGVDVLGHTKQELYDRAASLHIAGRSRMNKEELGQAIARKQ